MDSYAVVDCGDAHTQEPREKNADKGGRGKEESRGEARRGQEKPGEARRSQEIPEGLQDDSKSPLEFEHQNTAEKAWAAYAPPPLTYLYRFLDPTLLD